MEYNITDIIAAAQQGYWFIFAGMALAILVQIAKKWLPAAKIIPKKVLPYLVVTLGVIGAGATVLASGGTWMDALNVGVQTGLSSLGMYAVGVTPIKQAFGKRNAWRNK